METVMQVVKVKVTSEENHYLKIVWSNHEGFEFPPYSIDMDTIKDKAEKTRNELYGLVKRILSKENNKICAQLDTLAKCGNELYKTLFSPVGYSDSKELPKGILGWLKNLDKPFRIHFTVPDRVHISWGLIYDGDITSLSNNSDILEIENYIDFWCIKYSVSTAYNRIPPLANKNVSNDKISFLPVFHKDIYNIICNSEDSEKDILDHIISTFCCSKLPIFDSKEFYSKWESIVNQNILIYFCCHAMETDLALGAEDTIMTSELREKATEILNPNNICIAFLNGCSTAAGHQKGGFLEATGQGGFFGFIGTETKIPDIFAIRFGADFLQTFFYSGKPLYEIMNELRRRHWPLSLLYGLYCYPTLSVKPSSNIPYTFKKINFSFERIGSNEL